jgi:hypothetical protein
MEEILHTTSTTVPTPRPKLATSILVGGFAAGLFDYLSAVHTFGWGVSRGVASGLLGKSAFQGGAVTWTLGLVLHFFIAFFRSRHLLPLQLETQVPQGTLAGVWLVLWHCGLPGDESDRFAALCASISYRPVHRIRTEIRAADPYDPYRATHLFQPSEILEIGGNLGKVPSVSTRNKAGYGAPEAALPKKQACGERRGNVLLKPR